MGPVVIAGAVAQAAVSLALIYFKWRDLKVEIARDTSWRTMWHERIMDERNGPERP